MAVPLLTLAGIKLRVGRDALLDGADLSVAEGDRICLVGRNGSGKSTLLKIAAGAVEPDSGMRFLHPSATLRYLPQEIDLSGFDTTLAYAASGLGPLQDTHEARLLLGELGLTGDEAPRHLSGGETRRAALAHVLAARPDLLLLDEPTNHLDISAIEWLEDHLKVLRTALVLVSHDRRFLEALSRSTVWLDRGVARRTDRGFDAFETWRDEILEQEEIERHKLDRKIVREEHWMHGGVTARRKRNMRRVRELDALRQTRREQRKATGNVRLEATEGGLSGRLVAEASSITKAYGGPPVVSDFSVRILRGDRVGIVGPNGAGKTTLLKMLTGALEPDSGTVRLGVNLTIATLDQGRESLEPDRTLAETLTGGRADTVTINGETRHVVGYMKDFLFSADQARTPVKVLSGGERARLTLARALSLPSNLLVLDEPTNDLDIETLDLLQEMLAAYNGTVILVSHDRDFLDRVATSVIAPEGDGRWLEYAGGYSDMLAQRRGSATVASAAAGLAKPVRDRSEPAGPSTASTGRVRKLSFRDKHALETLPATIARLEGEVGGLRHRLEDAGLYARDRAAFERASADLARMQAELAAAEDEWLRIELLREEVEGSSGD